MTVKQILAELKSLGDERVRALNIKRGGGENQFGVKLGDIRKIADRLKSNHELALELWDTGNTEAKMLAMLLMKPAKLSVAELDRLVRGADSPQLADWMNAYIVRKHKDKESLRRKWVDDKNPWAARAGWDLTAERIGKSPEGLDIPGILDRIESEMAEAPSPVQWTMNNSLAGIGIHFPKHRKRAIAIGEKLGIYRDYPVPKGCTSPFAPIWINEIVRRKSA